MEKSDSLPCDARERASTQEPIEPLPQVPPPSQKYCGIAIPLLFSYVISELYTLRWLQVLLLGINNFTVFFTGDALSTVALGGHDSTIQSRFLAANKVYTNEMNMNAMSINTWPSVVMTLVGGYLIDHFLGLRKSYWLCMTIGAVCKFMFQFGVIYTNYALILTSFLILGITGSTFFIGLTCFIARWFKGHPGGTFAFGITMAIGRLGTSLEFMIVPELSKQIGVVYVLWIGTLLNIVTVLSTSCIVYVDYLGDKHGHVLSEKLPTPPPKAEDCLKADGAAPQGSLPRRVWSRLVYTLRLPAAIWILTIICAGDYVTSLLFTRNAKYHLQAKYDIDTGKAGRYVSLYYWTAVIAIPSFGFLVDVLGRNVLWMIGSGAGFCIMHTLLIVTSMPPAAFMILLGLCYSLMSAVFWTSVPLVVSAKRLGTAFGVIKTFEFAAISALSNVIGHILQQYEPDVPRTDVNPDNVLLPDLKGYNMLETIFLPAAAVSLLGSCLLLIVDRRGEGALSMNAGERQNWQKQRSMDAQALLSLSSDNIALNASEVETMTGIHEETMEAKDNKQHS